MQMLDCTARASLKTVRAVSRNRMGELKRITSSNDKNNTWKKHCKPVTAHVRTENQVKVLEHIYLSGQLLKPISLLLLG